MAEALGTVRRRGRRLLGGWWWPGGTKLIFDQMVLPVPEIMNGSLYPGWIVKHSYKKLISRLMQ
jgi:hypothetical protein